MEYVEINQEFVILQAIRMHGHGILGGNGNEAPFIFRGDKKQVTTAQDKLGMERTYCRAIGVLGLQVGYGLDVKTWRVSQE